jgi:hypothetical protein
MEFLRTKNYGVEMYVVFAASGIYFYDKFHGLVAIARITHETIGTSTPHYEVELTKVIDEGKIKQVIEKRLCKRELGLRPTYKFDYYENSESLPYGIDIELV